jgi:glycosyltransferase involved in cell wall biosynthesis
VGAAPPRVMVVIPAWEEQDCIAGVVEEARAALPDATVVVVDDGSRDATRQRALDAGATVLSLPFNLGVGGALRCGLRFARRTGHDVVVQVDGDGQHDPREVPALLAALAEADLVVGARFAGQGDYAVRGPRRWAMRGLAAVLSRTAGTTLTDVTSGFRAFGPRARDLLAETLPTEYLGDTVDALVVASRAGLRIRQQPVAMRPRQGGTPSQSPVRAGMYLVRAVLALCVAALRREVPAPPPAARPDAARAGSRA